MSVMRKLILLVVIVPFIILLINGVQDAFKEVPEDQLTAQQKVERILKGLTFTTPQSFDVLLNEERVDKNKRESIKLLLLKSDVEYLPMSPRVEDKLEPALDVFKKDLPNYDFGKPLGEKASYFRMLTSNERDWNVITIQTDKGYFSRWEQRADLYQLIREE